LSIAYCRLVTPDGLLSCLRLQFLQHFEYKALDKVKVTKSFVLKIMSQNPSLESISVNLDCPESEVLEEANNPRLTKLINTVIICCSSHYSHLSFPILMGLVFSFREELSQTLTLTMIIILTKKALSATLKMILITSMMTSRKAIELSDMTLPLLSYHGQMMGPCRVQSGPYDLLMGISMVFILQSGPLQNLN